VFLAKVSYKKMHINLHFSLIRKQVTLNIRQICGFAVITQHAITFLHHVMLYYVQSVWLYTVFLNYFLNGKIFVNNILNIFI